MKKFLLFITSLMTLVLFVAGALGANYYLYYLENDNKFNTYSFKGTTIVVDKAIDYGDIDTIIEALYKVVPKEDLEGLKFIAFNQSHDYLRTISVIPQIKNLGNLNHSFYLETNLVGLYTNLLKKINIYYDRISEKAYFTKEEAVIFVVLHEIGHHADFLMGNPVDSKSEYRAYKYAIEKMEELGYQFNKELREEILHRGDRYSGKFK